MPRASTPGTPVQIGGKSQRETPMYEGAETVSPLDRKIGPIRLKGAPLTTFLDVISAQSGVSFIVADGVENRNMTVFLRQTTVREALELLLRVKGLTYQRIGRSNTFIVQKRSSDAPNLMTKIYTLNYIPLIPMNSAAGGNDEKGGSSGDGEGGASDSVAILSVIKGVLGKNGSITTDARSNAIIITDVPETFPQIEQIIAELDKKAPQILIEAQIVEINTSRLNELGIEWGGSRGEMAYFQGGAHTSNYLLRPGFFSGDQWKKFFGSYTGEGAPQGGGDMSYTFDEKGLQYGVFSLQQLQATFRALISRGEGRYLGKPKIIAMNNKTARIETSKNAAIGIESSTTETATNASTERAETGLILDVTPQVNKEGYITLQVSPEYSDVSASNIAANGATIYDPIKRKAQTLVRVKNGQTVVIGGMLSSNESKTVRKVPLLGYIPIIGWLFTSVSSSRSNTDLVIFITPTILVD
jgi:type IV pilus assembly protein PilQ